MILNQLQRASLLFNSYEIEAEYAYLLLSKINLKGHGLGSILGNIKTDTLVAYSFWGGNPDALFRAHKHPSDITKYLVIHTRNIFFHYHIHKSWHYKGKEIKGEMKMK
jgi:hypothetical protein